MRMKKSILWENFPLLLEERKERKNSAIPKIFIGNPPRPLIPEIFIGNPPLSSCLKSLSGIQMLLKLWTPDRTIQG